MWIAAVVGGLLIVLSGAVPDMGARFVECFDRAAVDVELPADPEFRAALHDYMCWAVDEVLSYSDDRAVVPRKAGMPRWSWDGLQAPVSLA